MHKDPTGELARLVGTVAAKEEERQAAQMLLDAATREVNNTKAALVALMHDLNLIMREPIVVQWRSDESGASGSWAVSYDPRDGLRIDGIYAPNSWSPTETYEYHIQ